MLPIIKTRAVQYELSVQPNTTLHCYIKLKTFTSTRKHLSWQCKLASKQNTSTSTAELMESS